MKLVLLILISNNELLEIKCQLKTGRQGKQGLNCPEGLNFIEEDAFRNCTGLRQIVIPGSETEIDEKAFRGCGVVTVFAREGSKAQKFAEENEMPFFPLVQ